MQQLTEYAPMEESFQAKAIYFACRITSTLREKYPDMLFVDVTPDYVSLPQLDSIREVRTQSNKHPDKVLVSGGLASITVWRAGHCLIITDDMFRNNRTLALLNRLFGDIEDMHLCHVCMEDVDCLNSCTQCQYTICHACKMRCSKCPACRAPLPNGLTYSYADLRLAFPYA